MLRYFMMPLLNRSRSTAGDRVDVGDTVGQPLLVPGLPAVPGAEDLAAAAGAIHLVGIARMQGHRHHRAVGLDAAIEAGPGLPEVRAPVDRSVLAARGRAEAGVEHPRILGRHADVTGIGER